MSARSRTSRALAALSSPALSERHDSYREGAVEDVRRPKSAEFLQRPVAIMSGVEDCEMEAEGQQVQEPDGTRVRAVQEAVNRMEAELRQIQRKYAEQQRELEKLRTQREPAGPSTGEVKRVPEWARAIARATDMDFAAVEAYFYKAGAEREASLKYPAGQWSDEELRAIFKTKLGGKAKAQFEALPRDNKQGPFKTMVEAMRAACKGEQRTKRIVALGKLNKLRKTDKQSVADFCIELERLTQKAYPELDEKSLATTRANLLYEQLVAWPESYHLLEALETGGDRMYDALKETALRVERRRITLENANWLATKGVEDDQTRGRDNVECEILSEKQSANRGRAQETEGVSSPGDARPIRCFNCNGRGHFARECEKERKKRVKNREVGSLSAKLADKVCGSTRSIGGRSREGPQKRRFSEKWTTSLEIFGRKRSALLDTGSEVSILPARVLKQAIRDGINIDEVVEELPLDTATRVVDVLGNAMKFLTAVRVDIKEHGANSSPVKATMHVSLGEEGTLVLGTNVLPVLGYHLIRKRWRRTNRRKYDGKLNTSLVPRSSGNTTKWCSAAVTRTACVAPRVTEPLKITRAKSSLQEAAVTEVYGCEESVPPKEEGRRGVREYTTQTPIAPKIKRKRRVREGVKDVFDVCSKACDTFFRLGDECMTVDSEFHTRIHPSDGPRLADCSADDSTKTSIAAFVDVNSQDIRLATFRANCHGARRGAECGKPAQEHPDRVGKPVIRDAPIPKRHLRRVQLRKERSNLEQLFTVWVKPGNIGYGEVGGVITYGSTDTANCGPVFKNEPLSAQYSYQYEIDGISMGSYSRKAKFTVQQDLGTWFIAPPKIVRAMAQIAKAEYYEASGVYTIDCAAEFPDFKVTAGSTEFAIKAENLKFELEPGLCLFAFYPYQPQQGQADFNFGLPFNRQYCTIFDIGKKQIGFAESYPDGPRTTSTTSTQKPTTTTKRTTTSTLKPTTTTTSTQKTTTSTQKHTTGKATQETTPPAISTQQPVTSEHPKETTTSKKAGGIWIMQSFLISIAVFILHQCNSA
ncbi:hypothetical protein Y032_0295g1651 [Ancylostoma ceylanicum]|uniref:CCHC-type domain-containing protein n=1 Tax=Ancylostoma ceylanicum TaxID=53326 RepID=A0A016S559_9BILA|nr:hypothetical protein Y032_0295g1651 [Ancylostoma ceylanicum]